MSKIELHQPDTNDNNVDEKNDCPVVSDVVDVIKEFVIEPPELRAIAEIIKAHPYHKKNIDHTNPGMTRTIQNQLNTINKIVNDNPLLYHLRIVLRYLYNCGDISQSDIRSIASKRASLLNVIKGRVVSNSWILLMDGDVIGDYYSLNNYVKITEEPGICGYGKYVVTDIIHSVPIQQPQQRQYNSYDRSNGGQRGQRGQHCVHPVGSGMRRTCD